MTKMNVTLHQSTFRKRSVLNTKSHSYLAFDFVVDHYYTLKKYMNSRALKVCHFATDLF